MTALATGARALNPQEIDAVAGAMPDIVTTPPEMPWTPGQPLPTGTGPYGGDQPQKLPN